MAGFDGGTLFRINAGGTGFTQLHDFDCFHNTNGCQPAADLIEGSDGALYGTTRGGRSLRIRFGLRQPHQQGA